MNTRVRTAVQGMRAPPKHDKVGFFGANLSWVSLFFGFCGVIGKSGRFHEIKGPPLFFFFFSSVTDGSFPKKRLDFFNGLWEIDCKHLFPKYELRKKKDFVIGTVEKMFFSFSRRIWL